MSKQVVCGGHWLNLDVIPVITRHNSGVLEINTHQQHMVVVAGSEAEALWKYLSEGATVIPSLLINAKDKKSVSDSESDTPN